MGDLYVKKKNRLKQVRPAQDHHPRSKDPEYTDQITEDKESELYFKHVATLNSAILSFR